MTLVLANSIYVLALVKRPNSKLGKYVIRSLIVLQLIQRI